MLAKSVDIRHPRQRELGRMGTRIVMHQIYLLIIGGQITGNFH